MKTLSIKREEVKRNWWVVDLEGKTLGRAASKVASILRGKNKPVFTPHVDAGDFVVAINASRIKLTGRKGEELLYHHTGYPGGLKKTRTSDFLEKAPQRLFREAVRGMLPKNPLGRRMLKKLKVYAFAEHPHEAQKPINYPL